MADELIPALRERGLRVTSQRVVVHRALRELDRHVTADELLDAVSERLPNVSLPTIYATLDLLEDLDADLDTAKLERAATRHGFEHERIEAVVHGRCERCRAA